MTNENFEKINTEGLHNAVENLLMRNDFVYTTGYYGLTIPLLAQRKTKLEKGVWKPSLNGNRLEVLTLIPIYNLKKDEGEKVFDYRGTLIYNYFDDIFGTQFVRQFTCVTQIFDFFEEDKW